MRGPVAIPNRSTLTWKCSSGIWRTFCGMDEWPHENKHFSHQEPRTTCPPPEKALLMSVWPGKILIFIKKHLAGIELELISILFFLGTMKYVGRILPLILGGTCTIAPHCRRGVHFLMEDFMTMVSEEGPRRGLVRGGEGRGEKFDYVVGVDDL